MARALAAAITASLLAVSGAGGSGAQTPKRGGTVVFGPVSELRCLSPVNASCGIPAVFQKVLEPAFVLAPDSTLRPQLVSSATFTRTPPFTVTLEIDPDARWSDRVPVSARDFVFTHDAIVGHLPPDRQAVHGLVRSVRAVGAKTVRVVLRSRAAEWRTLFPFVFPGHALRGQGLEEIWRDGIVNPRTGAPIGSGPFLVQSWERGRQLTLVRNPNYWGPHTAYLDRIVFRFCRNACGLPPPAEVLEALRQGDVDLAFTRDTAIVSELRRIPGVKVLAAPLPGLDHLTLRLGPGGHSALKHKLVRRALAYGIDRVAIARSALGELAPSYPVSNSAVLLNTSRYYRPNWDVYRYRPALARRLLEQAGCRRGADGIYACAGERLSLRFWTIAGATLRVRTVELIQRQLRRVGVEVELNFAPPLVLFNQILPSGAFDAAELTFFNLDATDTYGCGGSFNYTGYCQRLVTADFDQSDRILDAAQRARVLNRADARMAKDVPVIPLFQTPNVIAFRTTIRNVVAASVHELWNAEDWWLER
ncbi:MAG: peptide ABC transporter substrate-binding protein [Actinomycetota bacterium]|nr:peptide ABC transporter substrate-binding protein [Actinomycetota bacterium]